MEEPKKVLTIIRKEYPNNVLKVKVKDLDKAHCSKGFLSQNYDGEKCFFIKCDRYGDIEYRGKKQEYRLFDVEKKERKNENKLERPYALRKQIEKIKKPEELLTVEDVNFAIKKTFELVRIFNWSFGIMKLFIGLKRRKEELENEINNNLKTQESC
jgi:hypothetical protein